MFVNFGHDSNSKLWLNWTNLERFIETQGITFTQCDMITWLPTIEPMLKKNLQIITVSRLNDRELDRITLRDPLPIPSKVQMKIFQGPESPRSDRAKGSEFAYDIL